MKRDFVCKKWWVRLKSPESCEILTSLSFPRAVGGGAGALGTDKRIATERNRHPDSFSSKIFHLDFHLEWFDNYFKFRSRGQRRFRFKWKVFERSWSPAPPAPHLDAWFLKSTWAFIPSKMLSCLCLKYSAVPSEVFLGVRQNYQKRG